MVERNSGNIKMNIENEDFLFLQNLWEQIKNNENSLQIFITELKKQKLKLNLDSYMKLLTEIPSLSSECQKIVSSLPSTNKGINIDKIDSEDTTMIIQAYCLSNNIAIDLEEELINYNSKTEMDDTEDYITDAEVEYIKEINRIPLLTAEEEHKLAIQSHCGDLEAKKKLIEANLRLVVSRVKIIPTSGISFLDLIQEGNLGLIEAIEHYNPEKGCKLSTYAVPWIDKYCREAIAEKSTVIKKTRYMNAKLSKFLKVQQNLSTQLCREVTVEETASYLGLSKSATELLNQLSQDTLSLDKSVYEDSEECVGDYVEDEKSLTPEQVALQNSFINDFKKELSILNENQRKVILLRFGLIDGRCYTLQEIGTMMNVTRTRVGQLEKRAKAKLKNPKMEKIYNTYLNS